MQALLHNAFSGNAATSYGSRMESTAREEYIAYQREHGHPDLAVEKCGLFISRHNNWLAATPDGIVHDTNSNTTGLLEIKCPFSFRDLDFNEACKKSFYLALNKEKILKLKSRLLLLLSTTTTTTTFRYSANFIVWIKLGAILWYERTSNYM